MDHTILIATDSDSVFEFVKNIPLNAELIRAKTPEEADEKIKEVVPEVIVIDSDIAEGKGKELVKNIKKDPTFGSIPILYLKDIFEEKEDEVTVEWTLNKPFTKEDFVKALKSLVGEDVEKEEVGEEVKEQKEEKLEEKGEEEEVIDLAAMQEEEKQEEEVIDLAEVAEEPKRKIEEAAEVVSEFKEVFEKGEGELASVEREFLDKFQEYISYILDKKIEEILSKYEIKLVKKGE